MSEQLNKRKRDADGFVRADALEEYMFLESSGSESNSEDSGSDSGLDQYSGSDLNSSVDELFHDSDVDGSSSVDVSEDLSQGDGDVGEGKDGFESESDEGNIEKTDTKEKGKSAPHKTTNPAELSDSSDEEGPLLRIGNVPREWYDGFDHFGYDVDGKQIGKRAEGSIDDLLRRNKNKRAIYDPLNDRWETLTDKEMEMIHRIRHGFFPNPEFDQYEDIGFRTSHIKDVTTSHNAIEPKRRFVPSRYEAKRIVRMLNAIRNGWIMTDEERDRRKKEKEKVYLLWKDDGKAEVSDENRRRPPPAVPAPKPSPPIHAESYNPPPEYLFSEEERKTYRESEPEDRVYNFIPKQYECLRKVPGYSKLMQERFERCLDLYLCPRTRKKRLNIDPESLIPKLPSPKDLKPFPSELAMTYEGHTGTVVSISISPCGQWLLSGSDDCSVRLWEISTGRCFKEWKMGGAVHQVAFNPNPSNPLIAVLVSDNIIMLHSFHTGTPQQTEKVEGMFKKEPEPQLNRKMKIKIDWTISEEEPNKSKHCKSRLTIHLSSVVKFLTWHPKGDYFATVGKGQNSSSVLIHKLSIKQSQTPLSKNKGYVQEVLFHHTKPWFFVATKRHIKAYDLAKQELVKKMQCPAQWISCMSLHRSGDHLLVGSYDRRLCWYDMDLSARPFRTLKYHKKGLRRVCYHKSYPLFASCSNDGTVHIFHGTVYSDLMTDPLIVPVKVINAHQMGEDDGIFDCTFHPRQHWIFSCASDKTIKMFR